MKALVYRLSLNSKYAKILHWGKLITITGTTQIFVQLTGFLSGILIIRLLPVNEYALYTLANTMLGTMTILADSGIANGVMAEASKVWQDKTKVGSVLATGLHLRNRFGIISLIFTLPVLIYLLNNHGSHWLTTILITLAIIPAFFAALSDSLLEIVPKLHQDVKRLQKNQAEVSLGRVALSALFVFIFPFTFIAILANSIPRIYGNYQLKKISSNFANQSENPDLVIQKGILKSVNRTLPVVIYYTLSGQISIWLISLFGSTAGISQLGALGRIATIFNLFIIIFSTIVVPRFSRMEFSKARLLKRFLLIQLFIIFTCAILEFSLWLFSDEILWILGNNYKGLHHELLIMGVSQSAGLLLSICSQLVLSRGWFLQPYIPIGLNLSATIISIALFDQTSITGVLYLNTVVSLVFFLFVFFYGLIKISKTEN